MDYEHEMWEMGGNPLKDDLLKYGIITEKDILKAGILRDRQSAKWCLQVCLEEMETDDLQSQLRGYSNMLSLLDCVDFNSLTEQEVCDLAKTLHWIEDVCTYLQSSFANLYSSFSDLEKYLQKRAEAA